MFEDVLKPVYTGARPMSQAEETVDIWKIKKEKNAKKTSKRKISAKNNIAAMTFVLQVDCKKFGGTPPQQDFDNVVTSKSRREERDAARAMIWSHVII